MNSFAHFQQNKACITVRGTVPSGQGRERKEREKQQQHKLWIELWGSPFRPQWPAVHHSALNWGNGVMSASWPGLKSLITARFIGSHNPLLHPTACWEDKGGRNTEALHQRWYDATINYRGCQPNNTHTSHQGNVSNEKNMFWDKKLMATIIILYTLLIFY